MFAFVLCCRYFLSAVGFQIYLKAKFCKCYINAFLENVLVKVLNRNPLVED